jgi:vancomycin permeability regulator SanA
VIGFDAPDVGLVHGMRTAFRERFARLIAVLDVTILDRQPRQTTGIGGIVNDRAHLPAIAQREDLGHSAADEPGGAGE